VTDVLHSATAGLLNVEIVLAFDFKLIFFFYFGCILSRATFGNKFHNGIRYKNASGPAIANYRNVVPPPVMTVFRYSVVVVEI